MVGYHNKIDKSYMKNNKTKEVISWGGSVFFLFFILIMNTSLFAACPAINTSFTPSVIDICGPGATTISFVNNSTGANASTATYDWYLNGAFFDNTTGLGAPNNNNISAVGIYTYMLVANDSSGTCTDTFSINVVIHPIPNPSFTFNPNNQCAGTVISFNNTSTGNDGFTTYNWNFGDGNTSTATNPTHSYAAGGTYNVTLTMTNAVGCSNTFNTSVTASDIPVINISGDDGDGDLFHCLLPIDTITSETVTFFNSTTGAVSYSWDYGDGSPIFTTASNASHTHVYNSYGTFTVTFTALHANGCSVTQTLTVVFEKFVSASFIVPISETSGCLPHTVNPINASVNANIYVWDFGDGTPTVTTTSFVPPSHTYTTGGMYTITVTASNSCNSSTATVGPIIISGPPTANFSHTLGGRGCAPQVINFNNSSINAVPANNYEWDMGNGNTYSTTTNPPAQTYNQGQYTITLIANNACGSDTITQTVIIDTIPTVYMYVNPLEGCTPLTVNGFDSAFGGNLTTQWWGDGIFQTNNDTIPTQVFTTPPGNTLTTHTIRLRVSNQCGVFDSTVNIIVHPAVQSIFTPITSTICEGSSVTFSQTSYGDSLTFAWDFGNGNTANTPGPHTIIYNVAGTYPVQLITTGYCGSDTLIGTVTVNPFPIAAILPDVLNGCEDLTVNLTNNSSPGATSYSWTFGGGATPATSTVFNPGAVVFPNPGTNMITLVVDSLGCVSTDTAYIDVFPLPVPTFTVSPASGCSPLTVNFNNTSPITVGDTYAWDFGNGNTSNAQNPGSQIYTTTGLDSTYTIQLIIQTANGCIDSITQTVTANLSPIASITPDVLNGCEDLTVNFTNNSTVGATSYNWSFGGGAAPATSTAFNPGPVVFPNPGSNMVILTVDNFGCTDSDTVYIDVYAMPLPSFTATPNVGCSPLEVTIVNTSPVSVGDIYLWDLDNGNTSNLQTPPNQTYTTTTIDSIYNIQLIIQTVDGCTDSVAQTITVHPNPIAGILPSSDTVCVNENIIFSNNSVGATTYTWDFGDGGTSTAINPTYAYVAAGTYIVQLISSSAFACSDTITTTIVVDPLPTSNFGFTIECVGNPTLFTDSSFNAISWNWNFGDGNTSILQNPNNLYAVAGTYNVTLITTNAAGCTHTVIIPVVVNDVAVAAFSNSATCLGTATSFTDLSSGTPISWNWDFGDGNTAITQNPLNTYVTAGTYNVQLIVAAGSGCFDTITQIITVDSVPTASFTFTDVCSNDTTFFVSTSTGNPDVYNWTFGDGNTDNTNDSTPYNIYLVDGTYTVQLIAGYAASGCQDTITQIITAYPHTVPNFSNNTACLNDTTFFADLTTNTPTVWSWDFGDGNTSSQQNAVHTYLLDGVYNVVLTATNVFGCTDSVTQAITVNPLPTALFTFDTVCLNTITTFIDNSLNAVSWVWDFGDATTSASQNPTHLYAADGTYNVQLIVTNSFGCVDTIVNSIIVNPNPFAVFTTDTMCFGATTTFTDLSTGTPITWNWTFGDGNTANTQNTSNIYPQDSTYIAQLIITNVFGCGDTTSNSVIVLPQPTAGFDLTLSCAKQQSIFVDTSLGTPNTWTWDFGDGGTSTQQNPNHVYLLGGSYNVELIIGNGAGCADTIVTPITVSTVPVPGFFADTVCFGNVTTFTNTVFDVVPIGSYFWDFGDGINTSNTANPTYIYQAPGTYTVVLTATNVNGCDSTISFPVVVNSIPVANYMVDTVCLGSPTTFTDASTGAPNGWQWDFGDGGNSAVGPVTTHTYLTPGSFLTSLIVSGGSANCTDQAFQVVVVVDDVVAGISVNTPICDGDVINFIDNSVINVGLITNWAWNFGDGNTSTQQNPTYTYANSGTYTVILTVTSNGGCTSSDSITITVNANPNSVFIPIDGCLNVPSLFTDLSTGNPTNWVWDFGDGNTSAQQNPTNTYANPGVYNVTLTVTSDSGCTSSLIEIIRIYDLPTAAFTNNIVCLNDTMNFTDQSTIPSGTITNWQWDFGDGGTATQQNPTHSYSTLSQTFNVQLIVSSSVGCSDTIVQPVSVFPIPSFDFWPTLASGCEGDEIQFNDTSVLSSGFITSYQWDFGDGNNSFLPNPTHIYNTAGNYFVGLTMTTSDNCTATDTLSFPVVIYPNPIAGFTPSPNVTSIYTPNIQFIDQSTGATNYDWNFGDGFGTSTASNPNYSYQDSGYYTVTQIVISNFGCRDSIQKIVRIKAEFTLFIPNAFSPNGDSRNQTFFAKGMGITKFRMLIFDRWGEKLFESNDINEGWDGTYKGEDLPLGVYVYRIFATDVLEENHEYIGRVTLIK
jgi:gliding motility-associated-like protein